MKYLIRVKLCDNTVRRAVIDIWFSVFIGGKDAIKEMLLPSHRR
ncbi:hypothetical protein [Rhizobium sp. P38BS-XIX]|nr:hypothetical protein [Rhizobium sp. P38BS-XIX]